MTHDDIIRMAHLAGYIGSYADNGRGEQRFDFSKEQLIEFAKLVAAHEREACALLCDGWIHANGDDCAATIRARSEPPIR